MLKRCAKKVKKLNNIGKKAIQLHQHLYRYIYKYIYIQARGHNNGNLKP